jgi:hypothetical protein
MTASYPNSIYSYTPIADNVDAVKAEHITRLREEVVVLETLLGIGAKAWTNISLAEAAFGANAPGFFTVTAGKITQFSYLAMGKVLFVSLQLSGFTVNTPTTTFDCALPGGKVPTAQQWGLCFVRNGGLDMNVGKWYVHPLNTYIGFRTTLLSDDWAVSNQDTDLQAQFFYGIQ